MLEEVERWLSRRSWSVGDRAPGALTAAKRDLGTSVSVVLPALDEEETVGGIVAEIRRELMERVPLVDELVVIDSGSAARTAEGAAAAGARVVHRDAILPRLPAVPGKGEVLWRSLLVTHGDIVAFVDADLKEFSADFVSGIVGPLLTEPDVQFVKAMYDRPMTVSDGPAADGPASGATAGQGGRVTELMARPLLNMHWPQLAGFVQPLGGEYAATIKSDLKAIPTLSVVLPTADMFGPNGIYSNSTARGETNRWVVFTPERMKDFDALVIPGGESTTISMLLESSGLFEPLAAELKDVLWRLGNEQVRIVPATLGESGAEIFPLILGGAALTNARIVIAPGRVLERGTLVIRDGVIEAVAANAAALRTLRARSHSVSPAAPIWRSAAGVWKPVSSTSGNSAVGGSATGRGASNRKRASATGTPRSCASSVHIVALPIPPKRDERARNTSDSAGTRSCACAPGWRSRRWSRSRSPRTR